MAHNYFVPYKTILSFHTRAMNHTYWEVRFDTEAPEEVWNVPPRISRTMHQDNDELLKKVLSRTLLSFQTNKVIFMSVVLMGRFRKWHDLIRQTGESIAREMRIPFFYRDFREGWEEGNRRSRESGMYRQKYCGCIFSEKERFFKVNDR